MNFIMTESLFFFLAPTTPCPLIAYLSSAGAPLFFFEVVLKILSNSFSFSFFLKRRPRPTPSSPSLHVEENVQLHLFLVCRRSTAFPLFPPTVPSAKLRLTTSLLWLPRGGRAATSPPPSSWREWTFFLSPIFSRRRRPQVDLSLVFALEFHANGGRCAVFFRIWLDRRVWTPLPTHHARPFLFFARPTRKSPSGGAGRLRVPG